MLSKSAPSGRECVQLPLTSPEFVDFPAVYRLRPSDIRNEKGLPRSWLYYKFRSVGGPVMRSPGAVKTYSGIINCREGLKRSPWLCSMSHIS
jgi:hypothetical protein